MGNPQPNATGERIKQKRENWAGKRAFCFFNRNSRTFSAAHYKIAQNIDVRRLLRKECEGIYFMNISLFNGTPTRKGIKNSSANISDNISDTQ